MLHRALVKTMFLAVLCGSGQIALADHHGSIAVTCLGNGPIIEPDMDSRTSTNIQGPSLILVPDWVENPLGRYYLYFADHRGSYIRMAYADKLQGPWTVYTEGTLQLQDSFSPSTCPPCSLAPYSVAGESGIAIARVDPGQAH